MYYFLWTLKSWVHNVFLLSHQVSVVHNEQTWELEKVQILYYDPTKASTILIKLNVH